MSRPTTWAGSMLVVCTLCSHRSAVAADVETTAPSREVVSAPLPSPSTRDAVDASPLAPHTLPPLPPGEVAPHREQRQSPRGQLALTVGLPIFPGEFLHGELAVDGRYGYKFWWLVPYFSVGFRQTRLDPLGWPWEARMRKLLAWHVTVGTRLEFPASQKLLPFVGIAVERNYWAYTEDSTSYCHESYYPSYWRCYKARDWKTGHALKPQVGLLYKPEPSLALEFWIEYVHVVAPGMFNRSVGIFHPALGLAWHH